MKRDAFGRNVSPLVRPAASVEPAAWLAGNLLPWGKQWGTRVCSVAPLGFEAYVRILHPAFGPPPDRTQLPWREIGERLHHSVHAETQWETLEELAAIAGGRPPWHEDPAIGRCPPEVRTTLGEHLSRHTQTPAEIYYAMWIGFADVQSVVRQAPQFTLPGREYALLNGPITAFPSVIESKSAHIAGPSLSWPADRAWCVATEIDFRWTYVAGTEAFVSAMQVDQRLEVLRTVPEHRGDIESDWRRSPPSPETDLSV